MMLKRKLFRMSFFCQGIYLIIAASNGGNLKLQAQGIVSFAATIDTSSSYSGPKLEMNAKAEKFAATYIKNNNEGLARARERSVKCFDMMDSIFSSYGLPVELKYLAVVESELDPNALSHVGALGPWQLMPATARLLGLKVSGKHDERKYFKKSTVAAAKYIRDLYGEFGDWLLVLAAYNGGPKPVYTAIRKSGSHNFWKLQNFLPAETRGHVKRFISTHYFFEGTGSVTTLTKTEMNQYLKSVALYQGKFASGSEQECGTISAADSSQNSAVAAKTIVEANLVKTTLK